jgi:hypothetical protein
MSRFICLFIFLAFGAVVTFFALQNRRTLRRRAAQNALSASSFSLVTDRDKPACHDVHFATATERPRWESIQVRLCSFFIHSGLNFVVAPGSGESTAPTSQTTRQSMDS